jgi:hypothetical protein
VASASLRLLYSLLCSAHINQVLTDHLHENYSQ